jgi:hypothetical protein
MMYGGNSEDEEAWCAPILAITDAYIEAGRA